ncbi:uncharacterized protein DS421_2g33650 [Arachis hypogaea]|nr:uncharacterized protein DS421_2g33650 [Arachis hypogaea]
MTKPMMNNFSFEEIPYMERLMERLKHNVINHIESLNCSRLSSLKTLEITAIIVIHLLSTAHIFLRR